MLSMKMVIYIYIPLKHLFDKQQNNPLENESKTCGYTNYQDVHFMNFQSAIIKARAVRTFHNLKLRVVNVFSRSLFTRSMEDFTFL
jgi:hypothetical protein